MPTLQRKTVIHLRNVKFVQAEDLEAGMLLVEGILLSVEHYKDYSIVRTLNAILDLNRGDTVAVLATVDAEILRTLQER